MRRALLIIVALTACAAGCAPKTVPLPAPSAPKYPDFIAPTVPPALAGSLEAVAEDRGWRFLQAGDLKNASREFGASVRLSPAFYPAQAGAAYVDLAGTNAKDALARFEQVLQQQPTYAPALAGRGEALLLLDRAADAISSFDAAAKADPSLTDLGRRVEVLKFQTLQASLAAARDAAKAGKVDDAIRAYTTALASSPDSPYLHRELGIVESQKGDIDAALEHLRRAVTLDPSDAESFEQIGDILEGRSDLEGASSAYSSANDLDPSPALTRKIEAIQARADFARLPADYRAIGSDPQITRAELAALIGVRLAPLLQSRQRGAVVITDVRSNWALPWITSVVRAGVMDPYDNHAFQPGAIVRRSDLAQAAARLLSRIGEEDPAKGKAWESARGTFSDLAAGHLAYPAVSAAVAAGVMSADASGAFQPSRAVTGAEAIDVMTKLEALAGSAARQNGRP